MAMDISLLFPYSSALPNFTAGIGKAKSIPDKLDLKAYLVGYQTAALDAEKRRFLEEKQRASQEYITAVMQLLQLMAARQNPAAMQSGGMPPVTPQLPGGRPPSGAQLPSTDVVANAMAASPSDQLPIGNLMS